MRSLGETFYPTVAKRGPKTGSPCGFPAQMKYRGGGSRRASSVRLCQNHVCQLVKAGLLWWPLKGCAERELFVEICCVIKHCCSRCEYSFTAKINVWTFPKLILKWLACPIKSKPISLDSFSDEFLNALQWTSEQKMHNPHQSRMEAWDRGVWFPALTAYSRDVSGKDTSSHTTW